MSEHQSENTFKDLSLAERVAQIRAVMEIRLDPDLIHPVEDSDDVDQIPEAVWGQWANWASWTKVL